jgi:aerobic C4-dicarboxylate transport protein
MLRYIPKSLAARVSIGIVAGIVVGALAPSWAPHFKIISDIFVRLVRMTIPPLVFITIVTGIAGMGSLKEVGLLGVRALVVFQLMTITGLALGLGVAALLQPGAGFKAPLVVVDDATLLAASGTNWRQFLLNIVPESGIGALAEGNMLAVLTFALFFGAAMAQAPVRTAGLRDALSRLGEVFFGIMALVMQLSPYAAFAAMAFAIGEFGLDSLWALGWLALTVYVATALFVVVVLGGVSRFYGFSLWRLVRHLQDELLLVLGTSSSQSAMPQLMAKLESAGCHRAITGLIIPTGYAFNLVGTAIYLAVATVFIAQTYNVALPLEQLAVVLGVLILTSKGASGVAGSGFVTLAATLVALPQLQIPAEGIALVLGVDRFLSAGRSTGNVLANSVATVILAKKEGAFVSTGKI